MFKLTYKEKLVLLFCSLGVILAITNPLKITKQVENNECVDTYIECPYNLASQQHHEYKISEKGKNFIKQFETCRLDAYHISGEKYNTIGWGHQLNEKNEKHIKHISQSRADKLFDKDIEWVNAAVNRLLNDINPDFQFSQGIVDGLASLTYNCGEQGVRDTDFYQRLKNCRFKNGEINQQDLAYTLVKVKTTKISKKGHIKRREGEYALMCSVG